jgi:hypothetical protein
MTLSIHANLIPKSSILQCVYPKNLEIVKSLSVETFFMFYRFLELRVMVRQVSSKIITRAWSKSFLADTNIAAWQTSHSHIDYMGT